MSLDIWLEQEVTTEVLDMNITHNMTAMAGNAGIYQHLWRPTEVGVEFASDLIDPLTKAVAMMQDDPKRFKAFNPVNGWGSYDAFLPWLEELLEGCKKYPRAKVGTSR